MNSSISLYFHFPFCTKKCDYCHFYVIPHKEQFVKTFMEAIKIEWKQRLPLIKEKSLCSIYFGGGTPSLLKTQYIAEVLSWIKASFSLDAVEITLEANPENITTEKVHAYLEMGINRMSIGVQTLDDQLLPLLGREHNVDRAIQAIEQTSAAGINNLSIDLMYDLPRQSLSSWHRTLKRAVTLPITHLSLYNLVIEQHTIFFKHKESIIPHIPSPETSHRMLKDAISIFAKNGLKQYEISAFARNGLISQHNTGYWTGRSFLGFGPSAFSYWNKRRFRNHSNLQRYARDLRNDKDPIDYDECLDIEAQRREAFVLQLRLLEGVHLESFEKHFGTLDSDCKDEMEKLIANKLLSLDSTGRLCSTEKGRFFYDDIASTLI